MPVAWSLLRNPGPDPRAGISRIIDAAFEESLRRLHV